jgi:hypothetical protein
MKMKCVGFNENCNMDCGHSGIHEHKSSCDSAIPCSCYMISGSKKRAYCNLYEFSFKDDIERILEI